MPGVSLSLFGAGAAVASVLKIKPKGNRGVGFEGAIFLVVLKGQPNGRPTRFGAALKKTPPGGIRKTQTASAESNGSHRSAFSQVQQKPERIREDTSGSIWIDSENVL